MGTGSNLLSAPGEVTVDTIAPLGPTSVGVRGVKETAGFMGLWSVDAQAWCADPIPGQAYITTQSAFSAINKSATAVCPAGTQLTGVGADLLAGAGEVVLDDITPNAALTAVTVWGREEDPFAAFWAVRAVAVCADPLPGLQLVQGASGFSPTNKVATATCPANKVLLGGGGDITNGLGSVQMDSIYSDPASNRVTVQATEMDPYGAMWEARAYGFCAFP